MISSFNELIINLDEQEKFLPELWLPANIRSSILKMVEVLAPNSIVNIKMQQLNFAFTDVYLEFNDLILKLENISATNLYAPALINSIKSRMEPIFNTLLFRTGIFLDKRLKPLLKNKYVEDIINYLCLLNERFNFISTNETKNDSDIIENRDSSLLDQHLGTMEVHYDDKKRYTPWDIIRIKKTHRLDLKVDILNYWNEKNKNGCRISKIALSILSIPSTQVTVERSFSDLEFIFRNKRSPLRSQLIEDIIFLRLLTLKLFFYFSEKKI